MVHNLTNTTLANSCKLLLDVAVSIALVSLAVSLLLLAAPADAQWTNFPPSQPQPTLNGNMITYMTGLDGGIWYTVEDPGGLNKNVATGNNPNNPFDIASEAGCPNACTGVVSKTSLATACAAVGVTCVDKWVRFPGSGSFLAGPQATNNGPLCLNSHTIKVLGQNGIYWWTLFDAHQAGTATTIDSSCPSGNPFKTAGEAQLGGSGIGFVNQSLFQNACSSTSSICYGIWMQ